jgi:hypothetical protein
VNKQVALWRFIGIAGPLVGRKEKRFVMAHSLLDLLGRLEKKYQMLHTEKFYRKISTNHQKIQVLKEIRALDEFSDCIDLQIRGHLKGITQSLRTNQQNFKFLVKKLMMSFETKLGASLTQLKRHKNDCLKRDLQLNSKHREICSKVLATSVCRIQSSFKKLRDWNNGLNNIVFHSKYILDRLAILSKYKVKILQDQSLHDLRLKLTTKKTYQKCFKLFKTLQISNRSIHQVYRIYWRLLKKFRIKNPWSAKIVDRMALNTKLNHQISWWRLVNALDKRLTSKKIRKLNKMSDIFKKKNHSEMLRGFYKIEKCGDFTEYTRSIMNTSRNISLRGYHGGDESPETRRKGNSNNLDLYWSVTSGQTPGISGMSSPARGRKIDQHTDSKR